MIYKFLKFDSFLKPNFRNNLALCGRVRVSQSSNVPYMYWCYRDIITETLNKGLKTSEHPSMADNQVPEIKSVERYLKTLQF